MLFVLLTNLFLYYQTISSIHYVSSLVETTKHKDRGKTDLFLYLRIFCVLCFSWIFGVVTVFIRDNNSILMKVIVFCFVIFNGLQGIFLFWVFTANRRVLGLYRTMFKKLSNRMELKREERARLAIKAKMQSGRFVTTVSPHQREAVIWLFVR